MTDTELSCLPYYIQAATCTIDTVTLAKFLLIHWQILKNKLTFYYFLQVTQCVTVSHWTMKLHDQCYVAVFQLVSYLVHYTDLMSVQLTNKTDSVQCPCVGLFTDEFHRCIGLPTLFAENNKKMPNFQQCNLRSNQSLELTAKLMRN